MINYQGTVAELVMAKSHLQVPVITSQSFNQVKSQVDNMLSLSNKTPQELVGLLAETYVLFGDIKKLVLAETNTLAKYTLIHGRVYDAVYGYYAGRYDDKTYTTYSAGFDQEPVMLNTLYSTAKERDKVTKNNVLVVTINDSLSVQKQIASYLEDTASMMQYKYPNIIQTMLDYEKFRQGM